MERTLVFLKPDAIKKKVIGKIIARFEEKGFDILKMKFCRMNRGKALEHYAHIETLPFFEDMIDYILSDHILFLILAGENVVSEVRTMMGSTRNAVKGTIRGDFGSEEYRNLIHASDSLENAEIEIKRFFG
jgi:nucleoside-diphosphate kinase